MKRIFALFAIMFLCGGQARFAPFMAHAPNSTNSTLGMDLAPVSDDPMPFLNIIKGSTSWWCTGNCVSGDTGEELGLTQNCLDSNGYPTVLANSGGGTTTTCGGHTYTFAAVATRVLDLLNSSSGGSGGGTALYYAAGDYLLQWAGDGNFTVYDDFSGSCTTSPCKLNITSPGTQGIRIQLTCTGTGCSGGSTAMHDISLVYCGAHASGNTCTNGADAQWTLCDNEIANGQSAVDCFNPIWLALVQPFKAFRMMKWMGTENNFQTNWSDRPTPGYVFYVGSKTNATINGSDPRIFSSGGQDDGVPLEIMVGLCNKVQASCWFNMPPLATNTYVTDFAKCAHDGTVTDAPNCATTGLTRNLYAYTEYANELWNQTLCVAAGSMSNNCVVQVANICAAAYTALGHGNACPYPASFNAYQANTLWSSVQAVVQRSLWRTAWGADSGHVVGVWGGTNGFGGVGVNGYVYNFLTGTDNCSSCFYSGTLGANIDAVAVAPYFTGGGVGYDLPDAWTDTGTYADGGVAETLLEVQTGVIPSTLDTGNCGNGAGVTCSTGGSCSTSNFCFTSTSGTISATPPNGQLVAVKFNAANTLNGSNQTNFVADGGSSFPILNNDGNCPGDSTGITAGSITTNEVFVMAFTSAISGCTGGSITKGWRLVVAGVPVAMGEINNAISTTAALNCAVIKNNGPGLVLGYESGQEWSPKNPVLGPMYLATIRSSGMQAAYTQAYNAWAAMTGGCTVGATMHFYDVGPYTKNGAEYFNWGALENYQQTSSPEYNALKSFTTPLHIPYLLNRDLDPLSNDNSPVFVNKAA